MQEVIAHGGMSVVYRGMDQRLLRPVCIKVFDGLDAGSKPAYATGHDHFVQEAFALSRLTHPNTMRIYDFGFLEREPALPFQISEWIAGGTLHQRVRKDGPLSIDAALDLLEPICGALAEAHAAGIVHRDVKPSNILLVDGPGWMPKLADFGIAKATARGLPHGADTAAIDCGRILLYSPGWSAPEQLRGDPVGPSADVFSFGLLIAFCLGGHALLPSGALMRLVAQGGDLDAVVARALAESPIPVDVAAVIIRACRAVADERYASIEALWDELAAAVDPSDAVPSEVMAFAASASETVTRDTVACTATVERQTSTFVAGGRVVRVVETAEQVELAHGGARLRVSLLADQAGELHLHVKGINCFVARPEGRLTGGIALKCDDTLQLFSPDRRLLAVVRCGFGVPSQPGRLFRFGASSVRVPQPAVLIDFEERQELLLIQQSRGT
ncbi:MAG: serine/threonine protein kinase [Myxococcales bacterium]|nr:serine/threonine protein kinase [Myxococcales bacterium]